MIAPLAKSMDWACVQAMTLMGRAYAENSRLEETLRFLKGPDFIPVESQPARVEFDRSLHFRFATPRPCGFAENNIVPGRLYRCGEQWQRRPAIILLPGHNDFASYRFRFPLIAREGNRGGFNVATLVPPYHFQRRPGQRGLFDSGDWLQFAERTAQGIAEIRALTGWLLGEGCPAVALWGYSAGAGNAGMTACSDARLAAVVMASPAVRFRPWVEELAVRPRIRKKLATGHDQCEKMNSTPMNLTMIQPVIPRNNILLIEGVHDLICLKEDIEHLGRSWGRPDIWRLNAGHVGVCCGCVKGLSRRVLSWLTPRLNADATKPRSVGESRG